MALPLSWMPVIGRLDQKKNGIVFNGGKIDIPGQEQEGVEIGLFICNRTFSEGSFSVDVRFEGVSPSTCADIVLFYDPQNRYNLNAGMTYQNLFAVRHYDTRWTIHQATGATGAKYYESCCRSYFLKAKLGSSG